MPSQQNPDDRIALLQGTLDLLILKTLLFGACHGQGIARSIQRQSEEAFFVDHGSLYLALQRLNTLGGHATRDDYERDLSEWLGLDGPGAKALADELLERNLAAADDHDIRFTEQGRALREGILTEGAQLTRALLTGLDAHDVETTIRTLQAITTRATSTTTEEHS